MLFILLVKKVSEIEDTHEEYDPYTILGLDQVNNPLCFYNYFAAREQKRVK